MTHEAPHTAPEPVTDPLAVFRRFPTALVVFLGVLGAAGIGIALAHLGRTPVAKCGSRPMSPDDLCTLRSRRSRTESEWTFQERLDFNRYENLSLVWAGVVIAVVAAIVITMVVIRWRRDIAVADQLTGGPAPLAAYAKATGGLTGFLTLGAVLVGGIGALLAVRSFGGKGTPTVGLVMAVIAAVVVVGVLWAARPKGCTLVWGYPPAVRVVTSSKVHDTAWPDMQYVTTLGTNPATMLSWVGNKDRLSIDDADFFALMRGQINTAVREGVAQRVGSGEVLDFRNVKVAGPTITIGKKSLPGVDLGGFVVLSDKNGPYFDFRNHQGKSVASTPVRDVGNIDVLFDLLAQQFGVRLQQG